VSFSQTLHLSSVTSARGQRATIDISLRSPVGKQPVALQWEASITAGQLSFVDGNLPPGPASQSAGKSLACTVKLARADAGDTFTSVCILSGGRAPISNGVVARLRLQISPAAQIGPAQIHLKGIAVFQDFQEIPLKPVIGTIVVHSK
jgi:hypothetical protein